MAAEACRCLVATVDVYAGGTLLATTLSDDRGRYLVDPGQAADAVEVALSGYSRNRRSIQTGEAFNQAFDARLTPLSPTDLIPAADGGVIERVAHRLEFPAGVFTSDSEVQLTPIDGQSLEALLPLGWRPLSAAQVAGPAWVGNAELTLPALDPAAEGSDAAVVRYVVGLASWEAVAVGSVVDGSMAVPVDGVGQYVLVVADSDVNGPAIPLLGEALPSVGALALAEEAEGTGAVTPESGRSDDPTPAFARIDFDNTGTVRSGTPVSGVFMEEFALRSGETITPLDTNQDFIAYQSADVASTTSGVIEFPISPSQLFPLTEFLEGSVTVTVESEQGVTPSLVGSEGGGLVLEDGSQVVVPPGGLASDVPVSLTRVDVPNLPALPAGFELVGGLDLDLSGQTPTNPLQLVLGGVAGCGFPG